MSKVVRLYMVFIVPRTRVWAMHCGHRGARLILQGRGRQSCHEEMEGIQGFGVCRGSWRANASKINSWRNSIYLFHKPLFMITLGKNVEILIIHSLLNKKTKQTINTVQWFPGNSICICHILEFWLFVKTRKKYLFWIPLGFSTPVQPLCRWGKWAGRRIKMTHGKWFG